VTARSKSASRLTLPMMAPRRSQKLGAHSICTFDQRRSAAGHLARALAQCFSISRDIDVIFVLHPQRSASCIFLIIRLISSFNQNFAGSTDSLCVFDFTQSGTGEAPHHRLKSVLLSQRGQLEFRESCSRIGNLKGTIMQNDEQAIRDLITSWHKALLSAT